MNPLNPERFMIEEEKIEQDWDRMQNLAGETAQRLAGLLEDACDRLEYKGSFLYDESPDKTSILQITDTISKQVDSLESPSKKDFIQMMLCYNMFHRRCRYSYRQKMFD